MNDEAAVEADYDPAEYHADTWRHAGPFCGCGDYSCPASNDPEAECVNAQP